MRYHGRTWYCKVVNAQQYMGYHTRPDKDREMWGCNMYNHVIRGGWSPFFTYHIGDVVSYEGDWYMCQIEDAQKGNHPIYKNGTTTTDWRKMTCSARKSPRLYVPHWEGWGPMGWNKYGHYAQNGGRFPGSNSASGIRLLSHAGDLQQIGRMGDYSGAGSNGSGSFSNRKSTASNFHRVNNNSVNYMWGHSKSGLYNDHPRIVQWIQGIANSFILCDDGQVYSLGSGTDTTHGLGHTSARRFFKDLGRNDQTDSWTTALTGEISDAFIVKIVGSDPDQSGSVAALDSDGNIWVWGEADRGIGTGNETDVTTPTKLSSDVLNGVTVVDLFCRGGGAEAQSGAGAFTFIDSNGLFWFFGAGASRSGFSFDNNRWRSPNPVTDFQEYGGIDKYYPAPSAYGADLLITKDGTLHYAGRPDYLLNASEVAISSARRGELFMPLNSYYHKMHQARNGRYSGFMGGHDVYEDVEELWHYASRVFGIVTKSKTTGELYASGYGGGSAVGTDESLGTSNKFDESSRATTMSTTQLRFPTRIDGQDITGMEDDVCHIGIGDYEDNAASGQFGNALFLRSNGRINAVGSEAAYAGFANGDTPAEKATMTSLWRPGEQMAGWDDTANQSFEVRGGTNSQNNIMCCGIRSDPRTYTDVTIYPSFMRMEQNGKVWVTGHGWHRNIEEADVYQNAMGSTSVTNESEDADLFGWLCVC